MKKSNVSDLKKTMSSSRRTETPTGEIILYEVSEGNIRLDVRLKKETIWLNLNQLSLLFDRNKSVISRHLNKVFKDGELDRESTVAKYATVQAEGERKVKRDVEYFNLDAIISVGYRVNSKRGTQFRIWATGVLRGHILKGYTVNESRLRDLNRAVKLIADTARRRDLSGDEAKALLALMIVGVQPLPAMCNTAWIMICTPKIMMKMEKIHPSILK
jgi:hypothetical protein